MIDEFRKHWLATVMSGIILVVGITWTVEYQLLVVPRDFEIQRLQSRLSDREEPSAPALNNADTLLEPIWLNEGEGATFKNGQGSVTVYLINDGVSANVTANFPDGTTKDLGSFLAGVRRTYETSGRRYSVYVLAVESNRARLAVGGVE